jgi:hypothetical protein
MGRFFLFYGGSSIELLKGETIVGRDPRCRIRIHAPWVSRQHARFSVAGDELWVEDLGSRNGTRLNGEAVTRPARAEVGDEVALGSHRVTIVVHDEDLLEPDTAVVEPFAAAPDAGLAFAEYPTEITHAGVTQEIIRLVDPPRGGRERRRHRRHSVELPIRYESDALQVDAVSLNLSSSGVFIQTPILDEVGTRCQLTVLGAEPSADLSLHGEVRRVVDHPGAPEPLGLGIEFAQLEDGARRWLESTIAGHIAARAPASSA